jgi:hypothetical protein
MRPASHGMWIAYQTAEGRPSGLRLDPPAAGVIRSIQTASVTTQRNSASDDQQRQEWKPKENARLLDEGASGANDHVDGRNGLRVDLLAGRTIHRSVDGRVRALWKQNSAEKSACASSLLAPLSFSHPRLTVAVHVTCNREVDLHSASTGKSDTPSRSRKHARLPRI